MHFASKEAERAWFATLPVTQSTPGFWTYRLAELWGNEAEHLINDLSYKLEEAIPLAARIVMACPLLSGRYAEYRIEGAEKLLRNHWIHGRAIVPTPEQEGEKDAKR